MKRSVRSSATLRMLLGGLGAQGLLIVSGILAARLLGPEDRGYLAFLVLAPLILATVGGLGLPQALTFWAARDRDALAVVIRTIAPVYVIQLAGLTLINVAVFSFFVWPTSSDIILPSLILLIATPAILSAQYAAAIAQAKQRFGLATVVLLLAPALYVAGLVFVAVARQANLAEVAAAWSLAYLVAAVIAFALVLRGVPRRPTKMPSVKLQDLFGFGLRSLPSLASPLQTLRLDQVAVWLLLGPLALGLYVVALAFTNLPILLATFMGVTISGQVAAQPDSHLASRSLARMVVPVAAGSLAIAALVGIAAPELISLVFGPDFAGAAGPARILLAGAVAASLQRSIGDGLRAMGDPAVSTLGEVVSWIALLPAILILPASFGLQGVALAVAASSAAGLAYVAFRWVRWHRASGGACYPQARANIDESWPQGGDGEPAALLGRIPSAGQE